MTSVTCKVHADGVRYESIDELPSKIENEVNKQFDTFVRGRTFKTANKKLKIEAVVFTVMYLGCL